MGRSLIWRRIGGVTLAAMVAWWGAGSALAEDPATSHAFVEVLIDPGPPPAGLERQAFRSALRSRWTVGELSADAARATVAVSFELDLDARLVGEVRQVSVEPPSAEGGREAFEAARRAVIACAAELFDQPSEKVMWWRTVQVVLDGPEHRVRW